MEPVEYLKVVWRRKRLIALCLLLAVGAAVATSPRNDSKAAPVVSVVNSMHYQAPSEFLETGAAEGTVTGLQLVAIGNQVAAAAAEKIDFPGKPDQLTRRARVVADETEGTISIIVSGTNAARAAEVANALADSLDGFLKDRVRAVRKSTVALQKKILAEADQRIEELDSKIAKAPPAEQAVLDTQRGVLLSQYSRAFELKQNIESLPAPQSGLETVHRASPDRVKGSKSISAPDSPLVRGGIGLILGLVLGAALALVLERFDSRIRSKEAAERLFGYPVLAEVPELDRQRRGASEIVVHTRPQSSVAEAYRGVRAALLFVPSASLSPTGNGAATSYTGLPLPDPTPARPQNRRGVVLVTSAQPEEGKTASAANLAVCLAEMGSSVLVLGADLRRPKIHEYFDVPNDHGLSDVVRGPGHLSLTDAVHDTFVPGVRLIPAGQRGKEAAGEIFGRLRHLIGAARRMADYVVIDTPPLLAVNDTAELLPEADAVVVVARVGLTTADAARRARELLTRATAPVLGVALVGVSDVPSYRGEYYLTPEKESRPGRPSQTNGDGKATGDTKRPTSASDAAASRSASRR